MDYTSALLDYIHWKLVLTCSLEVVGLCQLLKNFSFIKKLPTWSYVLIMTVLAVATVLVATYLPFILTTIILVVCVSQLGYEVIVQTVKNLVTKVTKE